jgi:methionyl-tRNA formyltransferase
MSAPPVKVAAQKMGYDFIQPDSIRHPDCIACLADIAPDFFVVVAFGQILPPIVLNIPKRGPVNVHASLLPRYRGPAPIQWALIRGEKETGVTTMLMDHGVDTGDILLSARTLVDSDDTAASLHDRLAEMGAELLVESLQGLWQGTLFPRAQKNSEATYAPLLKKEDGRLDWRQSAAKLHDLVRAMTPWPGAYCLLGEKRLRIYKSNFFPEPCLAEPGTVLPGFPDEVRIATGDGIFMPLEIQAASGKRMNIRNFLHGRPLPPGTRFS